MLACLLAGCCLSPSPGTHPNIPDESPGINGIVRTLLSVFDQVGVVALGEDHESKGDSDVRIALIRHPDFAKKVHAVVVEFASASEQSTLDRYVRGEPVSKSQLERIWKTTAQPEAWTSPVYLQFLSAVREVNSKLPVNARIRVFGGDDFGSHANQNRDQAAVSIIKEQALKKRGKCLVIYGATHFYRAYGDVDDILNESGGDITMRLEKEYPGRTFVVHPFGGPLTHPALTGHDPADYGKWERALKTKVRPVLVTLWRSPFRTFTAEEFIGRRMLTGRGGHGFVSVFKGSSLTLSQLADAGLYFGPTK